MGNQVLTFFFFWRPPCKNTARGHGGLQKKKVNTRFSMGFATQLRLDCTFANFFRSCSKFFSALEIKDNSKFNKGEGQGVQIKDGWQPYSSLTPIYCKKV